MELGERKNGSKKEARTQWERMEKIRGRISQPAVCFGISAPMSPITFFPFFRFFFFSLLSFSWHTAPSIEVIRARDAIQVTVF